MSLDVFLAVLKGYHDRIFDQRCIAVEAGFWSGYYSRATRPKPLGKVLKGMLQNKDRAPREHAEDVDVEEFLRREQEFKEKLNG